MKNVFLVFIFTVLISSVCFANKNTSKKEVTKEYKTKEIKGAKEEVKIISIKNFESYPIFSSCGAYVYYTPPGVKLTSIDLIVIKNYVERNICDVLYILA